MSKLYVAHYVIFDGWQTEILRTFVGQRHITEENIVFVFCFWAEQIIIRLSFHKLVNWDFSENIF